MTVIIHACDPDDPDAVPPKDDIIWDLVKATQNAARAEHKAGLMAPRPLGLLADPLAVSYAQKDRGAPGVWFPAAKFYLEDHRIYGVAGGKAVRILRKHATRKLDDFFDNWESDVDTCFKCYGVGEPHA